MTTKEQAKEVLYKLKSIKKNLFFRQINNDNEGSKFVLGYLCETNQETYASSLCDIMNISRARMSVLLEKLEQKGFIKKESSPSDSRKEVLTITPNGRKQVDIHRKKLEEDVTKIINSIGYDKIMEMIENIEKINLLLNQETIDD